VQVTAKKGIGRFNNDVFSREALEGLKAYNPFAGGSRSDSESTGGVSDEVFDALVVAGVFFRPNVIYLTHDEAVLGAISAVHDSSRVRLADSFLASLSTRRLHLRSGIGAFAILRNLPKHALQLGEAYCEVCGVAPSQNRVQRNLAMGAAFTSGGVIGVSPHELQFTLHQYNAFTTPAVPCAEDLRILGSILDVLGRAGPADTAKTTVNREIRNIDGFKCNKAEVQLLLETLGYCGILQPAGRVSLQERYVSIGHAPRSSHSSDWRYPVDLWRGKDGIDRAAMRFWFGNYRELSRFF
jgi:hypothetical protein